MLSKKIASVRAFEVLDSRGNPTISAHIALECGAFGAASVPSGASTGDAEAVERRDGNRNRYRGRGTLEACAELEKKLAPALRGMDASAQRTLDMRLCELDGTENKSRLGANVTLAVSLAAARAAARAYDMPLYRYLGGMTSDRFPIPMMNIFNGGRHADNHVDIQEFMIVPIGAESAAEAVRMGAEIYHALAERLREMHLPTAVGDEGGFAPEAESDSEVLEWILDAVKRAGYDEKTVRLALDLAASEWADGDAYTRPGRGVTCTAEELTEELDALCAHYPILSLEDPLGEHDVAGWKRITERLGDKVMLVGDDLFVTQKKRLCAGVREGLANAVLIKPNQVGTLTEAMDTVRAARQNGYRVVVSHRSGETPDAFITDLAVGVDADYFKAGAPARGERIAKYNRLLMIDAAKEHAAFLL